MFSNPFTTRAPKRPRQDSDSESDAPNDNPRAKGVRLLIKNLRDYIAKFKDQREAATATGLQYLRDLERILFRNIVPKRKSFSQLRWTDINNLGISSGFLIFDPTGTRHAVARMNASARKEAELLRNRLVQIFSGVNLQQEAGSRFIINALLETVRLVVRDVASNLEVAIIPELRIASGDGAIVENAESGFKIRLTGVTDYGIVRYDPCRPAAKEFIIGNSASADSIITFSDDCALLMEAKHDNLGSLQSCLPEAIGQAIVWWQMNQKNEIHFILTSGQGWIFSVLRREDSGWACYASHEYRLLQHELENFDNPPQALLEVIQFVGEWLSPRPTSTRFYSFQTSRAPV